MWVLFDELLSIINIDCYKTTFSYIHMKVFNSNRIFNFYDFLFWDPSVRMKNIFLLRLHENKTISLPKKLKGIQCEYIPLFSLSIPSISQLTNQLVIYKRCVNWAAKIIVTSPIILKIAKHVCFLFKMRFRAGYTNIISL